MTVGVMHSWIFRNRERLALVYGSMEPEAPAEAALADPESCLPAGEPSVEAQPADDALAGTCTRSAGEVLLVPMPRG